MVQDQIKDGRVRVLFMIQDSAYPQMGVLYLMDALEKAGIESDVVTCKISRKNLHSILTKWNPNVVGMSVMTAPQVGEFADHSIEIKRKFPDKTIVWGGVHSTILSDECAKAPYIDYVFVGQGEEVFPDLIRDVINQTNRYPKIVHGYSPSQLDKYNPAWNKVDLTQYLFSEQHSVRSPVTRTRKHTSLSFQELRSDIEGNNRELSSLASTRILEKIEKWDAGLYELDNRIFYYLLTSRGCPYKCTFCSEPLQIMNGNSEGNFFWNAHLLDWVKVQIDTIRESLSKAGERLDGIGLWDDMFWVKYRSEPRAWDIINYLAEENLTYLIEARADQLLRDDCTLYQHLADTNCAQVFVGAESASQETLDLIKKGTKVDGYYQLMELSSKVKVPLRMSFIVGFPRETDQSINATLDFCENVTRGAYGRWVNISGPKIFTPYPGTVEYQRAVAVGFRVPASHVEWGKIHRSTEAYLEYFPWMKKYSPSTLERLEVHFGKGYSTLFQY